MVVVFGEVVGHAGDACVDVGAAELLRGNFFAGRGLHERRAAEKDGAGALDDDGLVGHGRDVGPAGGAGPHHDGDLRDALGRHPGLVVEDAAEMLAIREDLGLQRQECATRVHEIDAGQPVLERDLLGAQVFLDRDRVVGPALDGRIVGDDDHFAAGDASDAGHQTRARRLVAVEVPGRERRQLEKRGAGIEEPVDSLANRQLALFTVALQVFRAAPFPGRGGPVAQLGDEPRHPVPVCAEILRRWIDVGLDDVHWGDGTANYKVVLCLEGGRHNCSAIGQMSTFRHRQGECV